MATGMAGARPAGASRQRRAMLPGAAPGGSGAGGDGRAEVGAAARALGREQGR